MSGRHGLQIHMHGHMSTDRDFDQPWHHRPEREEAWRVGLLIRARSWASAGWQVSRGLRVCLLAAGRRGEGAV